MDNKFAIIQLNLGDKMIAFAISILAIISNSMEWHALRRTVNKPFYLKILLSLTICDLLAGIFAFAHVFNICMLQNEFQVLICWSVYGFSICCYIMTSLLHLVSITLEKLLAVSAPLHHRKHTLEKEHIIGVIALSWSVPLFYLLISILIVVQKKYDPFKVHCYLRATMCPFVAKVILVTDIILIFSNAAIIWVLRKRTRANVANQIKSDNALILCMSIVFVFVLSTTPYVVVNMVMWDRPLWLMKMSILMFPLNQVTNSLIYFIQKYRNERAVSTSGETNRVGRFKHEESEL